MSKEIIEDLRKQLAELKNTGMYKTERVISSPQGPVITVNGREFLNFCANNYLGLAGNKEVAKEAQKVLDRWGYGMSSVRFICGTLEIHKELEKKVSAFLGTDDTILYAACFDANGGVFEPLLDKDCVIITDALNHASIIDGIRLAKAQRLIYKHNDMQDLEIQLKQSAKAKYRLIATDGVFSMDGEIANLGAICSLAEKYNALVMVDDSHATGFIGNTGRGSAEYCGVSGKVDIITTTFGKALGGAMGGCVSGRKEIVEFLRQKSRPYLFSNTLSPAIAGTTSYILDMLSKSTELRDKLESNTAYFRKKMTEKGFDIKPGVHPIVPIMLYDETTALKMAEEMLSEGIYVIGFCYPVVSKGQARIRVQVSAGHETAQLDKAVDAFYKVGKKIGVVN
ncbi:MAG: glycine C-acetyltransferase [Elusimicrobia bacterium RIFOXYA2_FULL_39_19]|nr:MAG: glycine C-acetyltransferase [Elusimicrobia bacterium RIFOXYA2_FULL_39_19]